VPDLIALAKARSGKPAVAYPNSGEVWDAARRAWSGRSAFDPSAIQRWVGEGARLVGGCCRVGPPDVVAITEAIKPR
jgi:homocysteine S-methyltransferase